MSEKTTKQNKQKEVLNLCDAESIAAETRRESLAVMRQVNGYKNRETWELVCAINSSETSSRMFWKIAYREASIYSTSALGGSMDDFVARLADRFRQFVEDSTSAKFRRQGGLGNFTAYNTQRAIREVDWVAIACMFAASVNVELGWDQALAE